ncbi:chondroadherin-like [Periplaneta americana]|uniref:chondroadherin-like n=1 Tax=Periplaneta americana TaxID=6978 RepID=UPI0037E922AF
MAIYDLLVLCVISVTVVGSDAPCPNGCSCPSEYRADCCNLSLYEIPKQLSVATRFLNISGNKLSSLKRNSFNVHNAESIKILDLSDNKISVIDSGALRHVTSLIFLYLSRNEIVSLEQNAFTVNNRLEFLKLDNNMLELPADRPFLNIPSLKSLDLKFCSISALPEKTFIRLKNLEELRLSHNQLQALNPKVFLPLKLLKHLYLSRNLLRDLHNDTFASMQNLETLDLSQNQLQSLSIHLFSSLEKVEYLDLSENRLKTLDLEIFSRMSKLQNLNLRKNILNSIHEKQFSTLNRLTVLDLSGNNFEDIHLKVICHLSNLTYLKVSDNRLACNCALWELWKWSKENEVVVLSSCEEPDFEFSSKNFEFLGTNNSCNATMCDLEIETEYTERLMTPMYVYVVTCLGILLVIIACGVTSFVVLRHYKEFFKRRNIRVSAAEYSANTINYIGRPPEDYMTHHETSQRQRQLQEELHRQHQETLLRRRVERAMSSSARSLPRVEHKTLRHSYHESRLPSIADDEREWFNADTLPANNRTSVFLASMSSHPAVRDPPSTPMEKKCLSEPKLKGQNYCSY